mgnify:CR=1 FL=1
MITAAEIRKSFLDYFARQGHQKVPSAPLVPKEDPSLLFTNAGMVQFKKVFLGQERREYARAVTSQKCLRVGGKHNDLENVGRTRRHHTFFEMLGNFSFGDYFKAEAIRLAWEYLTRELKLTPEKLYVSIFRDDDEAEQLWQEIVGIPKERIYRLDEEENFWAMGDTGPCGPCSEVLFDQGEQMSCGPDCEIGVCDCDRYLEIWNLVFMQYNRDESGTLEPLPQPSIDTGLGLERIAAICQGVPSNFDTDLFSGLIQSAAYKAGVRYKEDEDTDTALRVIADHTRAIAFMIADGILPSNEGRGYVLRRLIRRGFRFGRSIGLVEPFLFEICGQLVNEMGEAYPELVQGSDFMAKVVHKEEEGFSRTLDHGLEILEQELADLSGRGESTVPGEVVFKLYDTYGFPVDIVKDVAERRGFEVDEAGYDQQMQAQRERSKASWAGSGEKDLTQVFGEVLQSGVTTEFVGYETFETTSRIVALLDSSGRTREKLEAGESGYVATARTPFYGESGGQVGDWGTMTTNTDRAEVLDTQNPAPEMVLHRVEVVRGSLYPDQEVHLAVSRDRMHTARNHTCTHLLHAGLRRVLGDHVKQSGSLVAPDRLRFDFTHISPLSEEEIRAVEDEVNDAILRDYPVDCREVDYEQAEQEGAVGLFEEKYQDRVRIVEVPHVSKELCGGVHLERTGQAGSFYILSETGVSSGVRRIEAATGWNAVAEFRRKRETLSRAAEALKTSPDEVAGKVTGLQEQIKQLSREKEELQAKQLFSGGGDLMDRCEDVAGIRLLAAKLNLSESSDMKGLRAAMDDLRSRFSSGVILLAGENRGKAHLLLFVSPDLQERFTAPELIQEVAKEVGGSGGGRAELAQAGGGRPEGMDAALQRLRELIREKSA